jgi:glycosyltransferase involved in cell wall biosynthesis
LRRRAAALGVASRVVFTGFAPRPLLAALYRAATAFVLPSMHEGFGIPVLEAMQQGVPTACADAGALREVAGDATRWFDPLDTESMRAALAELLDDDGLRRRLVALGHARANRFTWTRSAAALRNLLLAAAGRARDGGSV